MPRATESWRFEWHRTWSDVWSDEFTAVWRGMLSQALRPHVYHKPEVIRSWVETRGVRLGAEPHFGIATSSTGTRVLLPWVVVSQRGRLLTRRTMEAAGRELFGYHTPLLAGAEPSHVDWRQFWNAARSSVGGVCDQALFRLVEPEFSVESALRKTSEDSPVLGLDACADLEDVLGRCTSGHRIDVKRQLRRVQERGPLTLWVATPDQSALAVDIFRRELWPAYRRVWTARAATTALFEDGVDEFLERVADVGVQAGWGHCSALRIGETTVAWHLGLFDDGRLYYWVPTHDVAWSKYSPGKLLLATLIAHGCREGWREIELLTGNHDYKLAWNPVCRSLTAISWTAPTPRGRLIAWYDSLARATK